VILGSFNNISKDEGQNLREMGFAESVPVHHHPAEEGPNLRDFGFDYCDPWWRG
jgi:hypothetical protein